MRHSLHNKDRSIRRKKYVASKKAIEAVGTKNYFGHTKNLPFSQKGFMVSKSSINLNKLQDVSFLIHHYLPVHRESKESIDLLRKSEKSRWSTRLSSWITLCTIMKDQTLKEKELKNKNSTSTYSNTKKIKKSNWNSIKVDHHGLATQLMYQKYK